MRRAALWLALLLAAPAWAAGPIVGITATVERNLTSCGVKAIVTGDDDSSAVLRLFYRFADEPNAPWDSGMVMVRRPHGPILLVTTGTAIASGEIFEGRILNMTPGRTVSYYIESVDGPTRVLWRDTTSCGVIRQRDTSGPVYYVNQRIGTTAGPGTVTAPYATINQARTALAGSPNGGAYGGIIVAPGEYHETLDLNFGQNGLPRFIEGDGTNPDSTIICGANENAEAGRYDLTHPIVWTKTAFAPMAGHVVDDSIYVTPYTAADSTNLVVLGWAEQLHRKTTLLALQADSTQVAGSGSSINTGERSGFVCQNDSLYVKRRNGQSPAGLVLHAGYRNNLLVVRRRNWRIAKLTFRFAGGICDRQIDGSGAAIANPGGEGSGVSAGIGSAGVGDGGGLVVQSCRFYGLNAPAVWVQQGGGGTHGPLSTYTCDSVTVANCIIDGLTVGGMAYSAGKSRIEESACQIVLNSAAANVYQNTITGSFNGIQTSGGGASNSDTTGGSRDEIYGNTLTNMPDDGIEVDGSHNINTLVMNNTVLNTNSGTSVTPGLTGPVFFIYNTFGHWSNFGVKISGNSYCMTRFWHNTITSPALNKSAIDASSGNQAQNLWFENNILGGSGQAKSYLIGPSDGVDTTGSLGSWMLNWNGTDSTTASNLNIANFPLSTTRSFVQIQALSPPWEKNGAQHSNAFVDSSRFDYRLTSTTLYRGMGRRIPGVNTGAGGRLYTGTTPNVGATSQ